MYAYPFVGYWKDVGTLESFWEANMDLLGESPVFDIYAGKRIFSRTDARPPQYIGASAALSDVIVTEGCEIYGAVAHSVLFGGVRIEPGAVVRDSVLMENVLVESGAVIEYAIIDSDCRIGAKAKIGGVLYVMFVVNSKTNKNQEKLSQIKVFFLCFEEF